MEQKLNGTNQVQTLLGEHPQQPRREKTEAETQEVVHRLARYKHNARKQLRQVHRALEMERTAHALTKANLHHLMGEHHQMLKKFYALQSTVVEIASGWLMRAKIMRRMAADVLERVSAV